MVTAVNGSIFPPSHVSFKHSEIVQNGIIFHRQLGRKLTSGPLFQLHTAAFCIDRFKAADEDKQLIKTQSVNGRLTVFNCFPLQQWGKGTTPAEETGSTIWYHPQPVLLLSPVASL